MKFLISILFTFCFLHSSTLNLSMTSSPSKLNPILPADSASSDVSGWLFNGLLTYDKNGNIKTELAKSYEFIDQTTLRFKLREDVKWHDKKPFTAKDVVFSYETVISPKVFTPLKSNFILVDSVKMLDDFTIEVKYKKPYFKALDIWTLSIIPWHILKDEKDIMSSFFNKKPTGTGSYYIKELKINDDVMIYANEDYFEGKPKIDKMKFKYIPDPNTEFQFQKLHKLDVSSLKPLQLERQIDKDFKSFYKIIEKPSNGYTYLGFNLRDKKFKDIRVRKAISHAINRQELIDILFFGHGTICHGPFLPKTFAYNDKVKNLEYSIEKAKALLKEAGFDENNPFEFQVVTNTGNDIRRNAAEIIQYQLAKAGIKMSIKVMEWQAFLNTVVSPRNFEAVLLGWGLALVPDAKPIWHSSQDKKGGFNLVGYRNKQIDKLIEEAEVTIHREELSKYYKEIFKQIAEDVPYLFLYIPNTITTVNKNIKNIEPTFMGIWHNQKEWIKP